MKGLLCNEKKKFNLFTPWEIIMKQGRKIYYIPNAIYTFKNSSTYIISILEAQEIVSGVSCINGV